MSREKEEASDGEAQAQVTLPSPQLGFGLDMQRPEFVWDLGGATPAFPSGPLAKDLWLCCLDGEQRAVLGLRLGEEPLEFSGRVEICVLGVRG